MYNTVQSEAVFFLASIAAGLVTAFLYDLIRISRRIISVSDPVVNGEDIIFFALAAVILFYTAFATNNGETRLYGFLGGALGVVCYALLVRNHFVNLGETTLKWMIKAFLWLLGILLFPLKIILRSLKKPVLVVAWYTGRALRRARRIAKCQGTRAKIRMLSALSIRRKK